MTDKIWKAELEITDSQEIEVPEGAIFLCAREQGDHVCVWFRCNPSADKVKRTIWMRGTGHDAPEFRDAFYLGTAIILGGQLVWHVFEQIAPP